MEVMAFVEPQVGAHFDDVLRVARSAEDAGFDGFFLADHFLKNEEFLKPNPGGLPGPTDVWLTLAALAQATSTLTLGPLMTSATFRMPALLAIAAAQVDQMSRGRLRMGIGAGWYEEEHHAYGVPFPPPRERFDRLEEQLEVITGLWETPVGKTFTHVGAHYTLTESPALPKPHQQPHPPIIIGGIGPRRTPRIAARFADEYNLPYLDVDTACARFENIRSLCTELGRDPDEVVPSATHAACVGRDDEELDRRAAAFSAGIDALRIGAMAGTPTEVVDKIGLWKERTGIQRLYLQLQDLRDLDQLDLIGAEVLPQVR
ncbi:TIGR03560 family F420-dependent LLM class oxidoreductase [Saccharomonospora azurea]|uniref:F420-dependent oxidoreductase, Rv1855c family n=1 Tax=Saccharomonospora azurea NA-128 TaxID=882081 RepID=H8GC81_9PSEU|nr:TIGR03560 family F420-dependent LLM class oxidoreductase [Saccharomonospora azurea]EHY87758.1 putative F420-dependent oxidoreductase, Rv1855c family [Saccharomonospora azurea NA-128]